MTFPLGGEAIRAAFICACNAELGALKPGNVHIHAGGHAMEAKQFADAAEAAAPWISDAGLQVGARVLGAVDASLAAARCNANLGIVLLCAPLAAAAGAASGPPDLRLRLATVLAELDREDAAAVFRAIAHASPAGLGKVASEDVAAAPTVTLIEAMALAADRDRIARAYVTDFEDIFAFGLPELHGARVHAGEEEDAVTTLHMSYMATFPDSHITRKHGAAAAQNVRDGARERERLWRPAASRNSFPELLAYDRELKEQGLNPGTTADFVVATLYADALIARSAAGGAVNPLSKDRSWRY